MQDTEGLMTSDHGLFLAYHSVRVQRHRFAGGRYLDNANRL